MFTYTLGELDIGGVMASGTGLGLFACPLMIGLVALDRRQGPMYGLHYYHHLGLH